MNTQDSTPPPDYEGPVPVVGPVPFGLPDFPAKKRRARGSLLVKKGALASTLALIQVVIVHKRLGKTTLLDLLPALSQKHSVAPMNE